MPGQVRRTAYIHLLEEPADALFFDYYPDKQSLSGGTHVGTKSAPGWASDVLHPRGNKSVDQKLSAIWNDYLDVKLPSHTRPPDFCGAAFALQWIYDFLGPGADDDQSNVFVLKTFVKPEYVVVESWNADVMIVGPQGDVLRVRLDLGCKFYREVEVDSSMFPKKKKGSGKKRKKPPTRAQLWRAAKQLGAPFLNAQEFLQLAFANSEEDAASMARVSAANAAAAEVARRNAERKNAPAAYRTGLIGVKIINGEIISIDRIGPNGELLR